MNFSAAQARRLLRLHEPRDAVCPLCPRLGVGGGEPVSAPCEIWREAKRRLDELAAHK